MSALLAPCEPVAPFVDLAFLQDLYRRVNQQGHTEAEVGCPACGHEFLVDVAGTP